MKRFDSKSSAVIAIAVAAVLVIAFNVVSNTWLSGLRLDTTQSHAYSTSSQVKPLFAKIAEPITVRLYFSRGIADVSPRHAVYYQRVRDLLQQYAKLSNGMIHLQFYNPEPFSDVEDSAVGYGLQAATLGPGGETGYFGLAATNSTDDEQVIPFFNLEREQFLEYDLAKLIYALSEPNRPKVGLISSLPLDGMPQMRIRPWALMQQLREFFTVENLPNEFTEIPKDISILFLVQPEGLNEAAQYAVDQFVMNGGRALVFVDPNAESFGPEGMQQMQAEAPDLKGIGKLMASWGVKMVDGKVVADRENAIRVNGGTPQRPVVSDYVAWLQLGAANVDPADAVTGTVKQLNIGTAGILEKAEGATTTVTPLISTGPQSMRLDREKVKGVPDVVALFRDFKPQNKKEMIAVRISGNAKSAFPAAVGGQPYTATSKQPIQVIVVADTDILSDRFWTDSQQVMGQQVVIPTADNGAFVANALENLSGAPGLSSLRGRGAQSRPFLLVDDIRRDAETRYRESEQALTGRLTELQNKVKAMKPREDENGAAILSDQDKRTIESYRGDILSTRKALRDVQRALRENIDRLEGLVAFVNIAAVPIVFGLILVVTAMNRRRRKRRAAEV